MSEMKRAYTIKPQTVVASPDDTTTDLEFPIVLVAPAVGMASHCESGLQRILHFADQHVEQRNQQHAVAVPASTRLASDRGGRPNHMDEPDHF